MENIPTMEQPENNNSVSIIVNEPDLGPLPVRFDGEHDSIQIMMTDEQLLQLTEMALRERHAVIQNMIRRHSQYFYEMDQLFFDDDEPDEEMQRVLDLSAQEATRAAMRPSERCDVERCPKRRVGKGNGKKMDPCTVCLCNFHGNSYYRQLPCGHCFHPKCIDRWLLQEDGRCPLCNQRV